MKTEPRLAVVGAPGVVGREVIAALAARDHPGEQLVAYGSPRAEGEEVEFDQETIPVELLGADAFRGVKAAVLAVPAAFARSLAEQAQRAGAWVVDLSGVFSSDAAVPLLAPGVNDACLAEPFAGRVVALAHPVTQALLLALAPLRDRGLLQVDATVLVGAAAFGQPGLKALEQQTTALLSAREVEAGPFAHRLAFNLVPQVGGFKAGVAALEQTVQSEAARLWGPGAPRVRVTAIAVPAFHGSLMTVAVRLGAQVPAEAARAAFEAAPGLKLLDDPDAGLYPMPMLVTADSAVHVGRVRADQATLHLVVAVDPVARAAEAAATLALSLASRD